MILRGSNICLYVLREASQRQDEAIYLKVKKYLKDKKPDSKVRTDTASLRFFRHAHRFVFVASDRHRIASIGGRGNCCSRHWAPFAPVPPLPASVPVTTRETSQIGGENTRLRCPTTGLRCYSPATLPTGNAGRNRHEPASKVSAPADIQGGDAVSDGKPFGRSDALSVRTKAWHHLQRRVGLQESCPQNNFRRIITAFIPKGQFCNHKINYFPENDSQLPLELLIGLLNSKLHDWYFRLGSTNASVSHYQLYNLPSPVFSTDKGGAVIPKNSCDRRRGATGKKPLHLSNRSH